LNQGCFNNSWDRFAIVCDGVGGNLFPTSSANCGNGGDYTAQCIGSWNSTIKNSLFDAAACSASSLVFQGGSTGWTVTGTTVRMKNDALHAFDIHGTKWTDNVLTGAVRFTDEYQRPLWKAGDMVWCNNTLNGSMTTAARLAAVPGAFVTTCQTTPPPPPPTPVDTFRVVVKVPSLPATVTVVKQ
jgi:hypothetical protein